MDIDATVEEKPFSAQLRWLVFLKHIKPWTLSGVASILTPHLAALPIFGAYSL